MEIKTEVINDLKELSAEQKEKFAKKLADDFHKWDEDRSSQVATAKEIMNEVYLKQGSRKKDAKDWKSNVHLNKPYNIKKAIKSMLWREVYQTLIRCLMYEAQTKKRKTTQKHKKLLLLIPSTK